MHILPNFSFLAANRTAKVFSIVIGLLVLLANVLGCVILYKLSAYGESVFFITVGIAAMVVFSILMYIFAGWINGKIHWYDSMLDALPYPISVTDNNMNWTFINKVVEDLQKVKRSDIIGKHCSNWGAAICNTPDCTVKCLLSGERDHSFFDQWGLNFKVDARFLHDRYGRKSGHIEIVQDITFLKKTQIEQANMIEGLGDLSNKFVNVSAEVTNNADKNVATTHQAADMVNSIKASAEKCSGYMEKLTKAMIEINEASHDIVNITKTISSIASRTNILAINASIEAARAGEAGKGFAVVAGEVKNLAKQSSKSVSDTNALINNSIAKAELGMQIANDTAESLAKIVVGISSSNELISEISKSTETQKDAVADINSGARQMASILSSGETKYLN